jgi:hypothetical protein
VNSDVRKLELGAVQLASLMGVSATVARFATGPLPALYRTAADVHPVSNYRMEGSNRGTSIVGFKAIPVLRKAPPVPGGWHSDQVGITAEATNQRGVKIKIRQPSPCTSTAPNYYFE